VNSRQIKEDTANNKQKINDIKNTSPQSGNEWCEGTMQEYV
jgi:hypothetical protein